MILIIVDLTMAWKIGVSMIQMRLMKAASRGLTVILGNLKDTGTSMKAQNSYTLIPVDWKKSKKIAQK